MRVWAQILIFGGCLIWLVQYLRQRCQMAHSLSELRHSDTIAFARAVC